MTHTTTILKHDKHRPGVVYWRATCSCGWYVRAITRSRIKAEDDATAHLRKMNAGARR